MIPHLLPNLSGMRLASAGNPLELHLAGKTDASKRDNRDILGPVSFSKSNKCHEESQSLRSTLEAPMDASAQGISECMFPIWS